MGIHIVQQNVHAGAEHSPPHITLRNRQDRLQYRSSRMAKNCLGQAQASKGEKVLKVKLSSLHLHAH